MCDGFTDTAGCCGALCGHQTVAVRLVQAAELSARYDWQIIRIFYVAHKFGRLAVSHSPSAASGLIDADRVREVSVPVVLASSMAYQSDAIQECATISYRRMARLTTVVSVFVCSLVRFWYARVLITVFGYGFECLSSHIT